MEDGIYNVEYRTKCQFVLIFCVICVLYFCTQLIRDHDQRDYENQQADIVFFVVNCCGCGCFMFYFKFVYKFRGGKQTFYDGGVRVITFVGGGYVPTAQRGTERDKLMHGSDWLPTIVGLATGDTGTNTGKQGKLMAANYASIETISNDLQNRLYIPLAKQVALKNENKTDNYLEYLVRESFDGTDLSQWLLYGDGNDNPRRNVGLSINTFVPFNTSISIVFESDITGDRYKFMYLTHQIATSQDTNYCSFCSRRQSKSEQRCKIDGPTENARLLFDLTVDANETTNLVTDDIRNLHISSLNHSIDRNKLKTKSIDVGKDENKKYNYNIKYLSDYKKNENAGLIDLLWEEAEAIVYEYQDNALFNNFLTCQQSKRPEADPSNFGNAYSPFFSWQEYQTAFQQDCDGYINDVLLEMYLSDYGDYL